MHYVIIIFCLAFAFESFADDSMKSRFDKAPIVALNILRGVPLEALNTAHLPEARFRNRVDSFYRSHYQELLEEAQNPNIELVEDNPIGACAQTGKTRFAKIYLDLSQCQRSITSVGDAARLLIGEYIHHLGHGDEFADWVKLVVIASWSNRFPDQAVGLFRSHKAFGQPDNKVDPRSLLNQVFLVPDVDDPELIMFFDRGEVNLHFTTPEKLGGEVQLIAITTSPVRWDTQRKALVTYGVWHLTGHENRPHYTGLMERYPRWFEKRFEIIIQVFGNGSAIRMSYQQPRLVNLANGTIEYQTIEKTYLRQPGKEVIDALFPNQ